MLAPRRIAVVYRIIGLTEALGAGWSVAVLIALLLRTPGVAIPWSLLLVVLGAYSVVGIAGVRLVRYETGGDVLSMIVQGVQLFQITTRSVAFRFLAGPQVTIFFLGDHFRIFAGVTASANLWRGLDDPPFGVGLNLVALAFMIALGGLPTPVGEGTSLNRSPTSIR